MQTLFSAQYVKKGFTSGAVMCVVAEGFRRRRCDGTIEYADLFEDLMVDGETYGCVKSFCYLETLLIEMVERILLLQLESEMDG